MVITNNRIKKVLQWTAFVLIIVLFIFVGTRDYKIDTPVDSEKFDHDYSNVNSDNVFTYVNASKVLTELKTGNAIIFMGYPNNKWSGYYASILNDAAKEVGISEIQYYDFYEDRENKNGTYQSIVVRLSNYLTTLDDGKQNIYAPTLIIIKNGQVVAYDNETAFMNGNLSPNDYWDSFRVSLKQNTFKNMFNDYLKNE